MNTARTALLLAGLTALFLVVGALIGGRGGMVFALILALGTNLWAYWNADRMVLSMTGAREVDRTTAPDLFGIVEQLTVKAGLPMPRLFIIESAQPNAFATGRDPEHAAVAATTGLLQAMTAEQVAGVLAHELGHVKHRDTLIMTMAATIAGAIGMLANLAFFLPMGRNDENGGRPLGMFGSLLAMILAPLAAMLVQMAISRSREYAADAEGAAISGHPLWLADALERLGNLSGQLPNRPAEALPALAHLFIVNPLHGGGALEGLFSTHPSLADRIDRLRRMAGQASVSGRGPWG